MKKWMFFVAAGLSVFAACSNEDDLTSQPQPEDGSITFELSAVNKLSNGISTRTPVYSQRLPNMSPGLVFTLSSLLLPVPVICITKLIR